MPSFIHCPNCQHDDNRVTDSRIGKQLKIKSLRRRRECTRCHYRWTTYEITKEEFRKIERTALNQMMQAMIALLQARQSNHETDNEKDNSNASE